MLCEKTLLSGRSTRLIPIRALSTIISIGTEEVAFKDFKDLILIFSEFNGVWYLISLAHGESTV